MGQNGSRVIRITDFQNKFNQECVHLEDKIIPIYGQCRVVKYQGMQFNICQSQLEKPSQIHPMSIHYFVMDFSYLIFPDFALLEEIEPSSLTQLLEIMKGVSQMFLEGGVVGMGWNRIGHQGRWGVVGEQSTSWAYEQILNDEGVEGVYFSPQQMIALSLNKKQSAFDPEKADMFAFAIMLLQIIFQESLAHIYNYNTFQIRLNPILQKLQSIKEEFGDEISNMFLSMLEIQEVDRFSFEQLLETVQNLLKKHTKSYASSSYMANSINSQKNMEMSRGNKNQSPNQYNNRTPKQEKAKYRNDVSPFRGRFGSNVKVPERIGRTAQKNEQISRSPMRRNGNQLQINVRNDGSTGRNTVTPRECGQEAGYYQTRNLSPLSRR